MNLKNIKKIKIEPGDVIIVDGMPNREAAESAVKRLKEIFPKNRCIAMIRGYSLRILSQGRAKGIGRNKRPMETQVVSYTEMQKKFGLKRGEKFNP